MRKAFSTSTRELCTSTAWWRGKWWAPRCSLKSRHQWSSWNPELYRWSYSIRLSGCQDSSWPTKSSNPKMILKSYRSVFTLEAVTVLTSPSLTLIISWNIQYSLMESQCEWSESPSHTCCDTFDLKSVVCCVPAGFHHLTLATSSPWSLWFVCVWHICSETICINNMKVFSDQQLSKQLKWQMNSLSGCMTSTRAALTSFSRPYCS